MFLHGLADHIQKEIFALDLPTDLDGLIELAIRVDAQLHRCDQRVFQIFVPEREACSSEPMRVGRTRLSR